MKINNQLQLARLIGKIDNDLNIAESDWIPRVAAWTRDALALMSVLPKERKRRKLEVINRIANFPCKIDATEIKVFDSNGCEIPHLNKSTSCCNNNISELDGNKTSSSEIAVTDTKDYRAKIVTVSNNDGRNFVLAGDNIELNFDDDFIIVESYEIATYFDEYYNCDCPYIYDDGYLLEALTAYVIYKYLCRGSKHQVFDLKSNNQATNPYLQWLYYKPKATASVKNKISKDRGGWNNFFYNSTFLPRNI